MLPYYKILDYEHSAIQQQCAILALELDLIHNPITIPWREISLDAVKTRIPGVQRLLDLYNFEVKIASLTVLKELDSTDIYSEILGSGARLEIPVIGCEYAHTAYYPNAEMLKYDPTVTTNYWRYSSDGAEEAERVTLYKPTIINTRIPRRTQVTRRHVRRISLMLDVGPAAYQMLTNTES